MSKLMVSLQHNDHLVWTAWEDVPPELAKLMTQGELQQLGRLCAAALRTVILPETPEAYPVERPLVEKRKPKK